jgi:protein-disulfide isomerase
MSVTPKFAAQVVQAVGAFRSPNTIELYLDYVCPFSAKMWTTLNNGEILKKVQNDKKYAGKVRFILRQQIQPWHPSSTLVHEAAIAVMQIQPNKFIDFSTLLFNRQKEYFDVNVVNETRNQTYKRLSDLAGEIGVDGKRVYDLLHISDQPAKDGSLNIGNGVTNDVKYMVKTNRLTGVHVTPTVVFNGAIENSISSSFTSDQWIEWLDKNLVEEHL